MVLAFRYNNTGPCEIVKINVNAPLDFYVGSNIYFKAEPNGGNSYKWDFGDSTEPGYQTISPMHAYKKPGWYTVTVTLNNKCDQIVNVYIKQKPDKVIADSQPEFYGPDTAFVNEPVTFKDSTPGATSWDWSFENGRFDSNLRSNEASWSYETPGLKEVYLKINGRGDNVGRRTIIVTVPQRLQDKNDIKNANSKARTNKRRRDIPFVIVKDTPTGEAIGPPHAEEVKPAEKTRLPDVTNEQVENYLREVVKGVQSANGFSQQLCGNLNLPVTFNDNQMTFAVMCNQLIRIKDRRAKKLKCHKIKQVNGCITEMKVSLKAGLFN